MEALYQISNTQATIALPFLFILAGVWRYVKGGDSKPAGWDYYGLVLALFTAWVATRDPVALVPAVIAWATLKLGYTDWEDLRWMLIRYGVPPLCGTMIWAMYSGVGSYWVLVPAMGGFVAGAAYGLLSARYGERWLRIVAGCLIIGGLAFL